MLEHVSVPVTDFEKAKAFYIAALAPLGYSMNMEFPGAAGFNEGGHTSFWIVEKRQSEGIHVAFLAKTEGEVQAFHAAALAAGGTDHGAPGLRPDYGEDYYAAFVLDLDGNNLEAAWFGGE